MGDQDSDGKRVTGVTYTNVLNVEEFERFCDMVGGRATERGLTEDKLALLLEDA